MSPFQPMTADKYLTRLGLSLPIPPTSPFKMQKVIDLSGNSVLDVGCRDGTYVAFCQALGKHAVGLDLAPSPPPGSDLPLVHADAQFLPFADRSFDTVLMFDLLEHISDEELALQEAARVSRRNILLSLPKQDDCRTFNPWNGLTYRHYTDPEHQRYYTPVYIQSLTKRLGYAVTILEHWCPVHPVDVYIGAGAPKWLCRLADWALWKLIRDKNVLLRNLFIQVSLER